MQRVAAIVSAYFCADFLAGRIDNLREQECEIVAVAQAGSDELQILTDMNVDNITITPDIPTIYAAWNMAINASESKYITNQNSDDRMYPGALAKMADLLDAQKNFGVVYSDVDMVAEIGGAVTGTYKNQRTDLETLLTICNVGPFPMWRRSLHNKYGFFDESYKVAGDYEFWLRLAAGGTRFWYMPESLGMYIDRPESAEHRQPVRTAWETARAKRPYKELRK